MVLRSWVRILAGVALAAALTSCSGGQFGGSRSGNASTDRQALVVARAISYPRQDSADGFVRAANSVAGDNGNFAVVEAEDLDAVNPEDPIARLVFAVDSPGSQSEFSRSEPFTACYEALFNAWGMIGDASGVDCPVGAMPIVPPDLPPKPQIDIPVGFDDTLTKMLTDLPAVVSVGDLQAEVAGRMPKPVFVAATGLRILPPTVETAVRGTDVGVSLWEGPGDLCLLGARVSGRVLVWRPSRVQLEPGELPCDPETALGLQGTRPPH